MSKPSIPTLIGLTALAACQAMENSDDVPARISNPTAASKAALQGAVNAALHSEVLLADDALTKSSILVIENMPPRTLENLPAAGRVMEPPFRFHLVKQGNACILIDGRDGARYPLDDTTCVAE